MNTVSFKSSPPSIRVVDLVRELGFDMIRVDNWFRRKDVPIALQKGPQGKATRVLQKDGEKLAVFLTAAMFVGPASAAAVLEDYNPYSNELVIQIGCVTATIDLVSIRGALCRAEDGEKERMAA